MVPQVSGDKALPAGHRHSSDGQPQSQPPTRGPSGKEKELVLGLGHLNDSYNFSFHIVIGSRAEEGQYSLNFHNCYNAIPGQEQPFDLTVMIREKNPEGFLSAAEIPLFKLYLIMSACFLAAGIFWVSVLCKNTYSVFKIHWLMAALAFTKSVSLLFHSINYTLSSSPVRRAPATMDSGRRSCSWWISSAVVPSSSQWSGPSGIYRTRLALTGRWQ